MKNDCPRIFGVLGSGVSYSLSPAIFEILFAECGMRHGYCVFDIRPKNLENFVRFASVAKIAGFNVTIPFKQEIVRYLRSVDSRSASCGSVNLVTRVRDGYRGLNTDWFGIERVFEENGIGRFSGKKILVIGAGGTARTALRYFMTRGGRDITVVNRGRARLSRMIKEMALPGGSHRIQTLAMAGVRSVARSSVEAYDSASDGHWDVVFNATPLPTISLFPGRLFRRSLVFEAAYGGAQGRVRPLSGVIGGVDMLIYQALRGFEIFTGEEIADYRSMKLKIKRRLRLRNT
jgi:shikimate dehydrogenase